MNLYSTKLYVIKTVSFALLLTYCVSAAGGIEYPKTKSGVSYSAVQKLATSQPDAKIPYADAPQQYGELWLPRGGGPFPVVVFIHGGCWLNAFDVTHTYAASTALAAAGYAVWALEYRRIGDPGGGWPGTFDDISSGLEYLSELTNQYPLDASRVFLVGHSAGGHLALWAAGHKKSQATTISAVITLAGITDLASYSAGKSSCQRAVVQLMGGLPHDLPDLYKQASPIERLPANVPTTLIQGTADRIVPMSQAEAYTVHANGSDVPIRIRRVEGAGHFDLIHPGTSAWQQLLEALTQ